jgi:hypothetical protein
MTSRSECSVGRRPLLLGVLAASLAPPARLLAAQTARTFVAGGLRGDKAFVAALDSQLLAFREITGLSGRAHQVVAMRDRGDVIAVARRADRWALVIDPEAVRDPVAAIPAEGHSFSGHVAVSPDGGSAAFVEIRDSDGAGFLSIRDTSAAWRERSRASTGGVGPHMIVWMDARAIAVANGGYQDIGAVTSPDGRIHASLAIVDPVIGRPTATADTVRDYSDYSLRHLANSSAGLVVALQRRGTSPAETPPVALWRGNELEPMNGPAAQDDPLTFYCSDVAVAGDAVIVTSSRAGAVGAWRLSQRKWLAGFAQKAAGALAVDANGTCHVAAEDGSFLRVTCDPAPAIVERHQAPFGWDNHGAFL